MNPNDQNPAINKDATQNPLAEHLNVIVSLPDSIPVKMVDARVLEDYEIWFFLSSLLFGAVIGFGVPFIQSCETTKPVDRLLGAITIVWLVLFFAALIIALMKRHALKAKSKEIRLKVTSIV